MSEANGIGRVVTDSTLAPGSGTKDAYCWLQGVPGYEPPAEWLAALPVPEKHSLSILQSFDEPGSARRGAFVGPLFFDPAYGLLTLAEREFIGVVVSALNACITCLVVHTHRLGELIADHGRARRIAINYRTVGLSAQERAIADYCVKLTEQPGRMEEADIQRLRDVGLTDRKIYFIVELVAVFNLTNRMTSGYGVRPDDEFMVEMSPTPASGAAAGLSGS